MVVDFQPGQLVTIRLLKQEAQLDLMKRIRIEEVTGRIDQILQGGEQTEILLSVNIPVIGVTNMLLTVNS